MRAAQLERRPWRPLKAEHGSQPMQAPLGQIPSSAFMNVDEAKFLLMAEPIVLAVKVLGIVLDPTFGCGRHPLEYQRFAAGAPRHSLR